MQSLVDDGMIDLATTRALSPAPRPASRTSPKQTPPSLVADLPPTPPTGTFVNSPDSGSIAWGARAGRNIPRASSHSFEESERMRRQSLGPIPLHRRTLSMDDSGPETPPDLTKARSLTASLADVRTMFAEEMGNAGDLAAGRLFPPGAEIRRPQLAHAPSEDTVTVGESPETASTSSSIRQTHARTASPASPSPSGSGNTTARRAGGYYTPGVWEESKYSQVDMPRSTSGDVLDEPRELAQPIASTSRVETVGVTSADLVQLPGTMDIGEGVAGGPQRDSRGKRIDLRRWRKQDPVYAFDDERSRATSFRGLKRFSRSVSSLVLPRSRSQTPVPLDCEQPHEIHLPERPDVPERRSSRRHSVAARRAIDSVGPPLTRKRYQSASTPDLLEGSRQRDRPTPHVDLQTSGVLDWLSEQGERTRPVRLDKPLPREPVVMDLPVLVPELHERRGSGHLENVPGLHLRATSTSSSVHLSTPTVSGSTPLPPEDGMRSKRNSIWGLSTLIKRGNSSETIPPKHSRQSSLSKLKNIFAGRSKASGDKNEVKPQFVFPRSKSKSNQCDSPSISINEKEEGLSRRRKRASGDWRDLVSSAKGSFTRLTSSSTPDLLSAGRSKSPEGGLKEPTPLPLAWGRSDVETNVVQRNLTPRTNLRPLSNYTELFISPQRLSRLSEIEEDERSNLDVTSIAAHHSPLVVPVPFSRAQEGEDDFKLPLDLGSNFNVDSFSFTDYSNVRTPDDIRFAKIGRVSQTSYFQPAALRPVTHSDMSPGMVDFELNFPMPPKSTAKLATHMKSFDELSLSAVNGGVRASPRIEPEADTVSIEDNSLQSHGLASARNWSWRSASGRSTPHGQYVDAV